MIVKNMDDMREVRILFTGVGRRVELLQAFRCAASTLNVDLKIYGADMTGDAPALLYCDFVRKVSRMKDPAYISELISICECDKIDILIPTIDTDLMVLSENVGKFRNTKILISQPDKIAICRDKNYTAGFFESCGCRAPITVNDYMRYKGPYPCFIKPKDGSSSVNAFKVEEWNDLVLYAKQIKDYVIQPFIKGSEYTVDIFCDFNGNPIHIVPRQRIQVRAGEVLKTKIVMDAKIITACKKIIDKFKPVGPMTIQLIRDELTSKDYFIEINPRYGGGAPLSIKAGANSPKSLLKLLLGQEIGVEKTVSDGAVYSRFDQSVCIQEGCKVPVKGVIFDLDDTLYSEKQYVKSGFRAIANYLRNAEATDKMWNYFESGKRPVDSYLKEIKAVNKKDDCLKIYREHMPEISLYEGVSDLLTMLKSKNIKIGIITDGRPESQKNKIEALGLVKLVDDIIITDELGGEQFRKPCDIAFRIIQRRWNIPFEQLMYVGDNVQKDAQAPRKLGMMWQLVNNGNGLYQSSDTGISISDFCVL